MIRVSTWKERYGDLAVVTGASSGIGAAFARALAARGMDLVVVARRGDRLEALAHELSAAHGVAVSPVVADLAKPDAVEAIRRAAEGTGRTIGLVVNNAGYGLFGAFEEQDPAALTAMVDVNCRAPVALARAFAPAMVARGRGGIIFVASTAAYQASPYLATYGATKAFDLRAAESLWAELEPKGVDVLAVSPGYTETEFATRAGASLSSPGGVDTPDHVVETALAALGTRPSVVHGFLNAALSAMASVLPTTFVARSARKYLERPQGRPSISLATRSHGSGRFVPDVVRMLSAFFAVAIIDVVVGSLLTGRLRFWFPNWLDANWATRPDPWVVYSQSYLAGVFFIPLLAASAMREFLPRSAAAARTAVTLLTAALLGFIAWWKGGLMVEHHKEKEAIGWLALTVILWTVLRLGEALPRLVAKTTPRALAARIAGGVSVFFLIMSVADPLLTVGLQRLPWSKGLFVEIAFFVPAGLILAGLAIRLRTPHSATLQTTTHEERA